jgi:DNA-binding MarR family transcriptional regulator/predicted N-acetyltransferase YhbS
MTTPPSPERIEAIRAFNRFYTRRIGVLKEGLLQSAFSLTQMRLLWELTHRGHCTATELARELDLDAGYLSRLLRGFHDRGLIERERSTADARHVQLSLSAAGRRAFAPLDERSREEVAALLAPLNDEQQQRLLQAIATAGQLLGEAPRHASPCVLRPHRAGDMGWVIARHGALYAQEYGFDSSFEALVARITADFLERFDATREACWIAEREGSPVGSVFLVQARDDGTQEPLEGTAQLRLLLIEPTARGLGLGERLVSECTRFARERGYRRIVLWTQQNLTAARRIYRRAGYRLTDSEPNHNFSQDLVGEHWELTLG